MKTRSAQEQLNQSQPLFGKTTFAEAYPQVSSLAVEVSAPPLGFGQCQTFHYSLQNPPGSFCPCPNPHCSSGGFDLGWFLHDLISAGKTEGEASGHCIGHERIGKSAARECHYSFTAKATIAYKTN